MDKSPADTPPGAHVGAQLVGYARVSTFEQTLSLQRDALLHADRGRIFTDTVSGVKVERISLAEALSFLRAGDTLVVWRLDRLGRSLTHLIETISTLHARGVGFRSLGESIDTTTRSDALIGAQGLGRRSTHFARIEWLA
jgi:DNA invertase Pin-like site-specific DNA recombinase